MTSYLTSNHNVEHVCALLARFIGESRYTKGVRTEAIAKVIANPNVMTVVVYRSGEAVGLAMAAIYEHPLFVTRPVSDLLVYVLPEHRGSSIAVRLVKMLEHWAREHDADGVMLGQSTQIGDMRRVVKFYEKLGYTMTGFNCVKEF